MADSIDVLGSTKRSGLFATSELSRTDDAELQSIVQEAAAGLDAPIALVSMVLDKVQFFRASTGLPPDLAQLLATDRDVSFCQYVVKGEEIFEVQDARKAAVPQHLVESYGIASYLGAPLQIGADVLGSLCVIDSKPRSFSEEERSRLSQLATRVVARLQKMRQPNAAVSPLLVEAVEPAFRELRNALMCITPDIVATREAVSVVQGFAALAGPSVSDEERLRGMAALSHSVAALGELETVLSEIELATSRVQDQMLALEAALLSREGQRVDSLVEQAVRLTIHSTKVAAGITLGKLPACTTAVPGNTVVVALAWLIGTIANSERKAELHLSGALDTEAVRLTLGWGEAEIGGPDLVARLRQHLGNSAGLSLLDVPQGIELILPRSRSAP